MEQTKKVRTLEEMPTLMDLKDLMEIMQVGRNTALEVIHSDGFPVFKVGRQYRISKDAFARWIDNQGQAV